MTKMRVHELAKELNKENKEVIDFLRSKNVEIKSHMSSIGEEEAAMVKAQFGATPADVKAAPVEKTATAPVAEAPASAPTET